MFTVGDAETGHTGARSTLSNRGGYERMGGSDLSGIYIFISTTWVRWVEYLIVLYRYRELVWILLGAWSSCVCVWTRRAAAVPSWQHEKHTHTPHYVMYKQVHLHVLRRHIQKGLVVFFFPSFLLSVCRVFFSHTHHAASSLAGRQLSRFCESRGSCLDNQIYNMPLEKRNDVISASNETLP